MAETPQQKSSKKKIIHQENRIAALKNLLVYYKEITETVREPFIILDKELYVVTANLAFYRKFKVRKKDTQGKRIYELGNNQWDAIELRELLEHILPAHQVFSNYEVTHDFPAIGRRTILLNARQVDSKQLILLAMEDVTVQRQLEKDSGEVTKNLREQRDRLQAINDTKDEFVSLASHQLRTPATVVKQYAGMLSQGYAGAMTEDQMSMVKVVYESNERQLEIIEDLLRVAKVDDGKVYLIREDCDVTEMMEAVILKQEVLFKSRGQTVTFRKPSGKITASIDNKLMLMVLDNLLDNAGKYSAQDGHVLITIEQTDSDTIVSIKDDGVGIRKSDRSKLFKKFSRIDNSQSISVGGTGLGLYWAKKILDLHAGSIEVTSVLHQGSTFMVKLPIGQPA